jgi:predicted nucleic acid-binding protein
MSWSRSVGTNVYFDSSALVKLLVFGEVDSDLAIELFRLGRSPFHINDCYAECRAAVAAAARSRRLTGSEARKAVTALNDVRPALDRLAVSEEIVPRAGELAERRALRGFDVFTSPRRSPRRPRPRSHGGTTSWPGRLGRRYRSGEHQ